MPYVVNANVIRVARIITLFTTVGIKGTRGISELLGVLSGQRCERDKETTAFLPRCSIRVNRIARFRWHRALKVAVSRLMHLLILSGPGTRAARTFTATALIVQLFWQVADILDTDLHFPSRKKKKRVSENAISRRCRDATCDLLRITERGKRWCESRVHVWN